MNDDMPTSQPLFIELPRRERLTAISAAVQRRPIVLVLGMHRSGTSLCSHILSALGVDMTDKIEGPGNTSLAPDNPHGHWERWEIVEFHDRILGLFNRDFLGRFHDFAMPVAWWADPRVAQIRREMTGFVEERMGEGWFGFKDPRTVRLMPVWHQILRELKLSPKVIFCLRNPAQVARSLQARDGLDPEIGEYRWLVHIVDFFRYANSFDFCTVEYEDWFRDPSVNLEKLKQFLDLPWHQSQSDLALMLAGIVDPGARHDDFDYREASQPLVRSLYKLAQRAGRDAGARDQIATIVSQFVGFQQLQRPFQQAFEEVAKTAAGYPEIEREAGRLNATLAEREAELRERAGRADELLAALQSAQAQLAARDVVLHQAEQEAEERAAAASAMQSEITALRETLAQAKRAAQQRDAAGESLQAEVLTLRDGLAQAERTGEDRATAAAAMQTEITALWETLTQAEREAEDRAVAENGLRQELRALQTTVMEAEGEAQQRAAAAEMLAAEVEIIRERLSQAERQAQQQTATAAALQIEIAGLQGTLTAAREVGKAAVAAFRIDTAAPTTPDRPRGWRQAVVRLFAAGTSF
jgi:hypothetical protein